MENNKIKQKAFKDLNEQQQRVIKIKTNEARSLLTSIMIMLDGREETKELHDVFAVIRGQLLGAIDYK